jgi:hypothetical protein
MATTLAFSQSQKLTGFVNLPENHAVKAIPTFFNILITHLKVVICSISGLISCQFSVA